jgi:predicted Ser/Thr protein kinase
MSDIVTCSTCGAPLTADAPGGLCPKCLLAAGFESRAPSDVGLAATAPSPAASSTRFVPPSLEQLAAALPQYEFLELLGQGGMGAVYKARQRGLDRLVAIKILPAEIGHDAAFAERFAREARALAKLSHPNIVAVYDFGRTQESGVRGQESALHDLLFYIVMEYVDGANLRQTIRAGGMTPEQALAVVPQICDALQFAHDEGVVHRDIKPENILVDKRGRVKIADFGLAKMLGGEQLDAALTGTHQVMGTLRYMAPEQMEGTHDVDHRADIYSLGVVFYELLTGELPLGRFAPPSKKVQIDVRLDEVVLRALAKEPELRWQHASEIKTEVATIVDSKGEKLGAIPASVLGREYRSKTTIFGLPLLHIAFGFDPRTGKKRVAKGIIAVGDVAKGVVAIGGAAYGGLCFGGIAVGLVACGGMSLGLLMSIGGVAVGGFAWGGLALGLVALGGLALGGYSFGGLGFGRYVLASNAQDAMAKWFFEPWAYAWTQWMIGLCIGVPAINAVAYGLAHRLLRKQGGQTSTSPLRDREAPSAAPSSPTYTRWVIVPVLLLVAAWVAVSIGAMIQFGQPGPEYRPIEVMQIQMFGGLAVLLALPLLLLARWMRTLPSDVRADLRTRLLLITATFVIGVAVVLGYFISPWNQPHVESHNVTFRPKSGEFEILTLGVGFVSHMRVAPPYADTDRCEIFLQVQGNGPSFSTFKYLEFPGFLVLDAVQREPVTRELYLSWFPAPLSSQPGAQAEIDELFQLLNSYKDRMPKDWDSFVSSAKTHLNHYEFANDWGTRNYVRGNPSIGFVYALGAILGLCLLGAAWAIRAAVRKVAPPGSGSERLLARKQTAAATKASLLVMAFTCLVLCMSFHGETSRNSAVFEFGAPWPWFKIEQQREPIRFNMDVILRSWQWLIAALGAAAYFGYMRIKKQETSPQAKRELLTWNVVAALITLGPFALTAFQLVLFNRSSTTVTTTEPTPSVLHPPTGFDVRREANVTYLAGHKTVVVDAAVSGDGKTLASADEQGFLLVRPLDGSGTPWVIDRYTTNPYNRKPVHRLAPTQDGKRFLVSGNLVSPAIAVVPFAGGAEEQVFAPTQGTISQLFSTDDDAVIAYGRGDVVSFYDVKNRKEARSARLFAGPFAGAWRAFAVSPDRKHFVVTWCTMINMSSTEPYMMTIANSAGDVLLSWQFPQNRDWTFGQPIFTAHDELVLCLPDGVMHRWNFAHGKWTEAKTTTKSPSGWFYHSAASTDGTTIYLATGATTSKTADDGTKYDVAVAPYYVLAVAPESGELLWKQELKVGAKASEANFTADPINALVALPGSDRVVAALWDGNLAIVEPPK